ncbi:uncharacterized protein NECHADRAFT_81167 [Fusarium vanettenii 77-13-4]|uniref:Uncharacterized protein n=1 Tax=Fusarium vanettenii (strain ATCC MYA-4622 / CBS 123669 / FGSC 9596 / NRRL 45880 / 77-13-4) TaxID=660122 RepID=C7ZHK1_FUSV7|nr:uncharacterized protein NECHADRAFT_81167 [Fusarium vanettenii 77-13-4]EEU36508.1 predicted protein [Fusarium vanettenii 77-13-4]
MTSVIRPDGTMGVYTSDVDPKPEIWENFDPSALLAAAKEEEEKKKKQKGPASVPPPSNTSVVPPPPVVHRERTWLQRFEAVELAFKLGQARMWTLTPPPSPPRPAPSAQ